MEVRFILATGYSGLEGLRVKNGTHDRTLTVGQKLVGFSSDAG